MNTPNTPNIAQVSEALLATLADLRDRKNPMDPNRGNTIAKVAAVMVDNARVQLEYLKLIKAPSSVFFEEEQRSHIVAPEPGPDGPRTALAGGYSQLGARK